METPREREAGEERNCIYARSDDADAKGRKKGVSGVEKGPSGVNVGGVGEERGSCRARVVPREHSRPSDSALAHLRRSPSFICLAPSEAWEADPN